MLAGKTWSPDSATTPGRLVALSHQLRGYVRAVEAERAALLSQIRDTLFWFESLAATHP